MSATATSSAVLIVGRIVAGIGGGGVMTGSFIIIAFSAKPQYRAAYMGILGLTFASSSVIGPLLGGTVTSRDESMTIRSNLLSRLACRLDWMALVFLVLSVFSAPYFSN